MATDTTLPISASYFIPNTTIATSSVAPITGSQLGPVGPFSFPISASYFLPGTGLATSSQAPITGSQLGNQGYVTSLVNFQQPVTGSGGGSGSIFVPSTFVMTGYYIAGATRETWSGASVNTPNPSGHPLVDIIVMGSFPPQNSAT